jgi:endonuclease/exonuclease/phosphatase (EEP) superfamily protein YafD
MLEGTPRRATRSPRPSRARSAWRLLLTLVSLAASAVAAVVVAARLLGGGQPWPLPKVAPFALLMLPVAVLAVVAAALARRWVPVAMSVMVLAPLLVWEVPQMVPGGGDPAAGAHVVTVATFNTKVGAADAAALVRLVETDHVDVLVLAESSQDFAESLRTLGLSSQLPYVDPGWPRESVLLWSRWKMTQLAPLEGTTDPGPRASVDSPWGPFTLTGLHAVSPTGGRIPAWERDFRGVQAAVEGTQGPQIVAGDFNASLDHGSFRDLLSGAALTDATEEAGLGHGWPALTWPTDRWYLPPLVSIDHVLVKGGIGVSRVATATVPGSDHRALIASLTLGP